MISRNVAGPPRREKRTTGPKDRDSQHPKREDRDSAEDSDPVVPDTGSTLAGGDVPSERRPEPHPSSSCDSALRGTVVNV